MNNHSRHTHIARKPAMTKGHSISRNIVVVSSGLLLLSLSACVSFTNESDPVQQFVLSSSEIQAEPETQAQPLSINSNSSRLLDSQRLWVLQPDLQVQAFAGLRWAMPLPELFQQALIETLETANVAVSVPNDSAQARLRLVLRSMQIELDADGSAQAKVAVLASFTAVDKPTVNRIFRASQPASVANVTAAAKAVDEASQAVQVELTSWLQQQLR